MEYLEGAGGFADRAAYPVPDVIFLDWEMPVMNGREYLGWHLQSAHSAIPVVALLGCGFEKEIDDARAMGAYCALIKPNSVQTLSTSVLEILGGLTNRERPQPKAAVPSSP